MLVAIGASLGGLKALQTILAALPAGFPAAVAVVQHREKGADDTLAGLLQEASALPVGEVQDKDPIEAGRVYLAPPDYHLLVEGDHFALSTEAPVAFARPSIDVLFESAADAWGSDVIGVLLTGANADGARGLKAIRGQGGLTAAQDPATAEAPAMPQAAIEAGAADRVLMLEEIGAFLIAACGSGDRA